MDHIESSLRARCPETRRGLRARAPQDLFAIRVRHAKDSHALWKGAPRVGSPNLHPRNIQRLSCAPQPSVTGGVLRVPVVAPCVVFLRPAVWCVSSAVRVAGAEPAQGVGVVRSEDAEWLQSGPRRPGERPLSAVRLRGHQKSGGGFLSGENTSQDRHFPE